MRYLVLTIAVLAAAPAAWAQETGAASLAALVAEARERNPEVRSAWRLADAAAARVPQAGALPDPTLLAGLMNVPISGMSWRDDEMAMASVQLGQMFPAPGVRAARSSAARLAHAAAEHDARRVELDVVARLRRAYYEALFVDEALEVLDRNRALLVDLAEVARSRFAVGQAPQQDVLRAQTEITRLDEQLAALRARRAGAQAEVNAILQRPPGTPLQPDLPERVLALAHAAPASAAFTAAALDAGLGGDFPSLGELQADAAAGPTLLAQARRVDAARAGVLVAERERRPGYEVMLGYGLPGAGPNRVSAMVSVPLPIFAGQKQVPAVAEARAELDAAEFERLRLASDAAAAVATHYADALRTREQIILLRDGVIPQARAAIESAAAAYQGGRIEFAGLLESQAALFRNEIELARQLADFGQALAALERAAGRELNLEK